MRTDIELKQLAADIVDGKVFTDRNLSDFQIADGEMVNVFPRFALEGRPIIKDIEKSEIALVYEYIDKASAKSKENGNLPTFNSYQILTQQETEKLSNFIEAYEALKAGFGSDSDDD